MQSEFDFDWAVIDRVDEQLTGCPEVRDEILRHTWCSVARLHRASGTQRRNGEAPRGCFANAKIIAGYIAERMKTRQSLVTQVERALAWLAQQGLIFVRRTALPHGRGSEYQRFVDFEACRAWLLLRSESTPSERTTSAPHPRPLPRQEDDHFRAAPATTSALARNSYRNDSKEDSEEDSPPPPSEVQVGVAVDEGERERVISRVRKLGIGIAPDLVRETMERGITPAFIEHALDELGRDAQASAVIACLRTLTYAECRTWRARQRQRARPSSEPPANTPDAARPAAHAEDDLVSWREKLFELSESQLAELLDKVPPFTRERFRMGRPDGIDTVARALRELEETTPAAASVDRLSDLNHGDTETTE